MREYTSKKIEAFVNSSWRAVLIAKKAGKHKVEPTSFDVSVPSISGRYIELDEQGKLVDLLRLQKERERLLSELNRINAKLAQFGSEFWLLNVFAQTVKKHERYGDKLRKEAHVLETKKRQITGQLVKVEDQIRKIEPRILQIPMMTTLTQKPKLTKLPSTAFLDFPSFKDPYILARNYWIKVLCKKQKKISNGDICTNLDTTFAVRGAPPNGIPEDWVEKYGDEWKLKYGYAFYRAAYRDKRTKKAIQRLISKAKRP